MYRDEITEKDVEIKKMSLSDQALGAIMMALQRSLMEQSDIVPVLKEFNFVEDDSGDLTVLNPPLVKFSHDDVNVLDPVID
tara:strand:+ start:279 stop:521 length:243 start_codon:yes stop_codon:yes gene_type:complete